MEGLFLAKDQVSRINDSLAEIISINDRSILGNARQGHIEVKVIAEAIKNIMLEAYITEI